MECVFHVLKYDSGPICQEMEAVRKWPRKVAFGHTWESASFTIKTKRTAIIASFQRTYNNNNSTAQSLDDAFKRTDLDQGTRAAASPRLQRDRKPWGSGMAKSAQALP